MSLGDGQRLYAVFEAVVKSDPDSRAALLEELCAGDPGLLAEVEHLLVQDAEAERGGFLAPSASARPGTSQSDGAIEGASESGWARILEEMADETQGRAAKLPPGLAEHPDYEIKRRLGRGGMGVVYLAENRLTGRTEVLKVLGGPVLEHPGRLERFLREIRAVAKLRHPNIVAAHSAARLGESLVLAMEYVDGLDLSQLVKARGPLPVADACQFVYQAALGLQHAHEHAMVHRDVKPGNLMLTRQGDRDVIKLLDFGLAKLSSEDAGDGSLTHEGHWLGTPDFIAPEQIIDARRADIRADIYSLGGTLYYLLTGSPPFHKISIYETLRAHHSADPRALNELRPDVPEELAAVVAKMLAKEPERRFGTPVEVAEALSPFIESSPSPSPQPGSRPGSGRAMQADLSGQDLSTASASKAHENLLPAPDPGPRRRRVLASAVAGALLVALAVAPLTIFKSGSGTIVFENLPEWSDVVVDEDTVRVDWPDGRGQGRARVRIAPGKHKIRVNVNGAWVSGEEVTVESGGVTPIVVPDTRPPILPEQSAPPDGPSSSPKRVINSVGMTLILIPPGEFIMGSRHEPPAEDERPPHHVQISSPYYLGAFEVTQAQYGAVMGVNPSHFSDRPENPVDDVRWIDAVTFCNRLSEREKVQPYYGIGGANDVTILGGIGYRLPTEAEWEYACRAGNPENVPFLTDAHLGRFAWMESNCDRMTHPVGKKESNPFGLFDMYGNVWEWCWDWVGPYSAVKSIDPTGPATGKFRILRGNGWWNGDYKATRPSFRLRGAPLKTSPNHDFGFRVAAGGVDGLPSIGIEGPLGTPAGQPPTPLPR